MAAIINYAQARNRLSYFLVIISILVSVCTCICYSAYGQDIRYEDYELQATDTEHSDQFGFKVSVYDNIAIIGDYADTELGGNAGAAHIFRYTHENGWIEEV